MKYIDAEKLKTKVKNLNLVTKTYEEQVAFNNALAMVVEIITSLQQEQPESRIMTREMIEGRLLQNDTESWNEDYNEEDLQTRFAFYTYKNEPGILYLSNLFVEEASRNRGLGSKILKAAEKVAETIGASSIGLRVKQNSLANAWYRKRGYEYVASEDGYDWLEKNLRPSWKPGKEELEALNYAIAEWDGGKRLEGLYALRNDLKKLK